MKKIQSKSEMKRILCLLESDFQMNEVEIDNFQNENEELLKKINRLRRKLGLEIEYKEYQR